MKYIVIFKYSYLSKPVKIFFDGVEQSPAYCYLMTNEQIDKLNYLFSACKLDTEKERKLQSKCAQHDRYEMLFIDVPLTTIITTKILNFL